MFPTVCYIIQVKYWDRKFDINKIKLIIYPLDFLLTKFIMQRQKLQIYFYLLFQLQPLHPICTKACVKFSPQYSLILFPGCFFLNLNLTTISPSSSTFCFKTVSYQFLLYQCHLWLSLSVQIFVRYLWQTLPVR